MTILEQIKSDRINAIKNKIDTEKSVLTVLVGEIDRNRGSKELTDDVVIATVVKMCKAAEETIAMLPKESDVTEQTETLRILSKYRPQLKNAVETSKIIMGIIDNHNANDGVGSSNFGKVMKDLKNIAGIDMKIASGIVRELLG
jgi:uncharacterized protein YqeY